MTIHVLAPAEPQQRADTAGAGSTAYDSVWAGEEEGEAGASTIQQPPAQQGAFERTMLSQDKIYVVLAVVLLIWLGVAALLLRTDRRLAALERRMDDTN